MKNKTHKHALTHSDPHHRLDGIVNFMDSDEELLSINTSDVLIYSNIISAPVADFKWFFQILSLLFISPFLTESKRTHQSAYLIVFIR